MYTLGVSFTRFQISYPLTAEMWPFGRMSEKFWHHRTAQSGKLLVPLFGLIRTQALALWKLFWLCVFQPVSYPEPGRHTGFQGDHWQVKSCPLGKILHMPPGSDNFENSSSIGEEQFWNLPELCEVHKMENIELVSGKSTVLCSLQICRIIHAYFHSRVKPWKGTL